MWWYLGNTIYDHLPPFSTSIATAWRVVEEMQSRGYSFEMLAGAILPDDDEPMGHFGVVFRCPYRQGWCKIESHPEHKRHRQCWDPAPLAICRAALVALGKNDAPSG